MELKQKYANLYTKFEQNKLLVLKCASLAEIILKSPETWDANAIHFDFHVRFFKYIHGLII